MYQAIEADIENGRVKSPELQMLPAVAHVMITWLKSSGDKKTHPEGRAICATSTHSLRGALKTFSNPRLIEGEKGEWTRAMERKHEAR